MAEPVTEIMDTRCRSTASWPLHCLEVSRKFEALVALFQEITLSTHWIGGWVGLSVGVDDMEKRKILTLLWLELRLLGHPARNRLYTDCTTAFLTNLLNNLKNMNF
jgi:hypothetical protein